MEGPGQSCRRCTPQSQRTAIGQCKRCNRGYELTSHKTCRPFACERDSIDCLECVEQALRTGDDQCKTCKPGFRLSPDMKCLPYEMASERTGDNQCAECNPNYELTPDMRCVKKPQQWLPRVNAIVYTKEVVEELFKQLDLNGDGKISSNEFSRKEVDDSVAKALAKLAMDKAFDFQSVRKPGDTDLMAIDRAFGRMDLDRDDYLSAPEFRDGVRSKQAEFLSDAREHYSSSNADELISYFSQLDLDKDGRLSRVEFQNQADLRGATGSQSAQLTQLTQRRGARRGLAEEAGLFNPFVVDEPSRV
eukprot:g1414.t1